MTLTQTYLTNTRPIPRGLALAILGSALLALSAKTKIDLGLVPVTLQSLVLLTYSMAVGTRTAVSMVLIYLTMGAFGLPVFAGTPEKGLGIPYILGPTGGYLLGFLLAAALVGHLAERGWDKHLGLTLFAMTLGTALLFIPGLLWLAQFTGWENVIALGLTPFLLGGLLKIALGAIILPTIWRLVSRF